MSKTFEQRRSARSAVAMSARCRTLRGSREFVALVDLTAQGCCVMAREQLLTIGQWVILQPDTLAGLSAQVQWTNSYLAGLRFEHPLYEPVYEHLARTFQRRDDTFRSALGIPVSTGTGLPKALRQLLLSQIADAEIDSLVPEQDTSNPYLRIHKLGLHKGSKHYATSGKVLHVVSR